MKIYYFDRNTIVRDYTDISVIQSKKEINVVELKASRYEYFVARFMLLSRYDVNGLKIGVTPLKSGEKVLEDTVICLNTQRIIGNSVTDEGLNFRADELTPVYIGINLKNAELKRYTFTVSFGERRIPVIVNVTDDPVFNEGADEINTFMRMKWLNSQAYTDDAVVEGYETVKLNKNEFALTGKSIAFGNDGMITSVTGFFDKSGIICEAGRELLSSPLTLDAGGLKFKYNKQRFTAVENLGAVFAEGKNESLKIEAGAFVKYQGSVDYTVRLTSERDLIIDDVVLSFGLNNARFMSGLGQAGGLLRKIRYTWKDGGIYDSLFLGDIDGGVEIRFKDKFGEVKKYGVPMSKGNNTWFNGGLGCVEVVPDGRGGAVLTASCGRVILPKGKEYVLRFELFFTPFREINLKRHFRTLSMKAKANMKPAELVKKVGEKCRNYIEVPAKNVYYNELNNPYPFSKGLKELISDAHNKQIGIVLEYCANGVAVGNSDFPALFGLKEELFGEGLRITSEIAETKPGRADNYLVENLKYIVDNFGIDGFSMLSPDYGSATAERLKKLLMRKKGVPGLLNADLDIARAPITQYPEILPFTDKLRIHYGEEVTDAVNMLIDVSGLAYGVPADAYAAKYKPCKGLLYGIFGRYGQSKKLDDTIFGLHRVLLEFGIADSVMYGFWDERNPVSSDKNFVYCTSYKNGDKMLVAIYNWSDKKVEFDLGVNPKKGFTCKGKKIIRPSIPGIQTYKHYNFNKMFTLEANKGMVLIIK